MNNKGVAETIILIFLLGGIFGFAVGKATNDKPQQTTIVAEATEADDRTAK